ncbi:MAG: hypothetical protein ABI374_03985, partial [Ginsengibacter sp.]
MKIDTINSLLKQTSVSFIISLCIISCKQTKDYSTWQVYGGNKEANHYSSLNQIDTNNVAQMQVAWTYHTN